MKTLQLVAIVGTLFCSHTLKAYDFVNRTGSNHAYAAIGFMSTESGYLTESNTKRGSTSGLSGLVALGGDFEHMILQDFGIGGLFRYFTTKEEWGSNDDHSVSGFTVGPIARVHFPHRMWNFYGGLGLMLASITDEQKTAGNSVKIEPGAKIAPLFQMGFLFAINEQMAAGVENTRLLGLGENINGWFYGDLVGKFRLSF